MLDPEESLDMLILASREAGVTLIELMIGLVVLALLLMVGLPSLTTWLQNTQIRNQTESFYAALQLARAEALRRNSLVRFQMVDTLTSACALSTTGKNWVVSLANPAGSCQTAPSDTAAPQILQKSDAEGSTPNTAVAATGGSLVSFNGLGRVANAGAITRIVVSNPTGGACQTAAGPMRCLEIRITTGGQLRMCDPAAAAPDPRAC